MLNIEDEFAVAAAEVGGKRGKDLGFNPSETNADFIFLEHGVLAELKCLDEDKMKDERLIERNSSLYVEELSAGRAPVKAFGTVQMSTAGFAEDYTLKIIDGYRVPIQRVVRDADSQIKKTAATLNLDQPTGVLLLANNNHTALDPWHVGYIVNEILATPNYSSINTALLFSGNLAAVMPGHPQRVDYWIQVNRSPLPLELQSFLDSLRDAWHRRLGNILGLPIAFSGSGDMQTLAQLESKRF